MAYDELHSLLESLGLAVAIPSIQSVVHVIVEVLVRPIRLQFELVIKNHEDRSLFLVLNEVDDGLVVNERDVVPLDPFSNVLLLLLCEHHPIEYGLQFFIGVVNTQLFK